MSQVSRISVFQRKKYQFDRAKEQVTVAIDARLEKAYFVDWYAKWHTVNLHGNKTNEIDNRIGWW